ncbi:hypothetical protein [Pyrobaculum islandicum]|uniref:hypothetical protein n=1 Tax=Pyrobaculum islandicum TaxID=2277 RepID=UPI00069FE9AF|nr:hypothetical protein [Pyrobaculum islandicum]
MTRSLVAEFVSRLTAARPRLALEKGDVFSRYISDLNQASDLGTVMLSNLIQFIKVSVGAYMLYFLNPILFATVASFLPVY